VEDFIMENNDYLNTPDLDPNPSKPSATDGLTLDPYGNQSEIEEAKKEVTAAEVIFGGVTETPSDPAPAQPQQPEAPQYTQPQQPEAPQYTQPQQPQAPQYTQPVDPQYNQQQPAGGYVQPVYDGSQNYQQPQQPTYTAADQKSKMAAGLLGIFLGSLGVHNFYLGYTGKAVAQLLISLLSCGTLAIASEIWGLVEGIQILTGSINTDAKGIPLKD
jgi:TM2 domain-containing membrane protein YozV